MEKLSSRLTRLFLILFTGITGYIAWFTFTSWERAGFLYPLLSSPERVLLIGAGALLLLFLTGGCAQMARKMNDRQERIFTAAVILFLFLGQVALILGLEQTTFMYDPYRVFDEALHMLSTHTVSGTALEGYYGIYPNNIPFTLICYWIIRLGTAFGLADAGLMVFLQVLNALCMDLAVFLTFRLLKTYQSSLSARLFLLLCLLNPLVYLWPGFVYTSTVSMPFLMGGVLLFLKLIHAKEKKTCFLHGLILGPVLLLGFKIRATVLITLIAGLIYLVLYVLDTRFKQNCDAVPVSPRVLLPGLAALVVSLVLSFGIWGALQRSYVDFDSTDTAFPVVSWLAMGLEGDGMFNTTDYYDTKNAATAEEKTAINEQKLKSRLAALGPSGWLDLAGRKMVRTWADGTDDYVSYLNQFADTNKLHTYLLGDKKDLLVCYMQMMRCFLFLAVMGGGISLFLRKKGPLTPLVLLQLNLLGGTFFHVLWETGELYSLCFSFLLFALAAAGLEPLSAWSDSWNNSRFPVRSGILLLLFLASAGWLFARTPDFTRTPVKKHDSVISQKTYTLAEEPGLTEGNTLEQTFRTNKPFNRVCIRVKNVLSGGKDSQYQITVVSETGDLLMDHTVTGADVFDYDYFYFGLEEETAPETMTEYTITITCQKGDADNSIAFLRYHTGNHDAYRPGTLSENGIELPNADLNFMVYRSYEDTYFNIRTWGVLCTTLLLLEALLLVYWFRRERKK